MHVFRNFAVFAAAFVAGTGAARYAKLVRQANIKAE